VANRTRYRSASCGGVRAQNLAPHRIKPLVPGSTGSIRLQAISSIKVASNQTFPDDCRTHMCANTRQTDEEAATVVWCKRHYSVRGRGPSYDDLSVVAIDGMQSRPVASA
jgi:hypothetical protein